MKNDLQDAIDTLIVALKEDPDYRLSWQANIAMAFKDEYSRTLGDDSSMISPDPFMIHNISNNAADYFLSLLCGEFKGK